LATLAVARALETLGIRRFYRLMTNIGQDEMLSEHQRPSIKQSKLVEMRNDARYFAWANVLRGGLYVPVVIQLIHQQQWGIAWSLIFLITFHTICIGLEIYKAALLDLWIPQTDENGIDPDEVKLANAPKDLQRHWYFDAKPFEFVSVYRAIGVEHFRRAVVWYTNKTKFSIEEIRAGKRVQYLQGSVASMLKYERDTRVGELMHLAALAFNVAPFSYFVSERMWFWVGFVGLILWLDLYLVMLQRYNRMRVQKLLVRQLQKRARRPAEA
jgi:hypothetical protein